MSKSFNFKKIDAFATNQSEGNPAGYVLLDNQKDINAAEMQQIAREMKGFVNEVGFVAPTKANAFALKYYSAEREVDFCGHATIAIMYDLLKKNVDLQNCDTVEISTNRGNLIVKNLINQEDAVFIMSPKPEEKPVLPSLSEIAKNLKINENEIDTHFPISCINAGLTTLIVPIKSLNSILKIFPDQQTLKEFCQCSQIDIIEVFTSEVSNSSNNYRTRVFAPTFGYLEDPATGSGNSAFGYYLINNNLWKDKTLIIEQNGLKDLYNIVKLQLKKDEVYGNRVWFGGGAVTRIEGKYLLHTITY
jgi:PhzF family phenazine biosynthesis protein